MENRECAISYLDAGTAASSFHVSDTIDWASLSAQAKNRVVIVQAPKNALKRAGPDLTQPDDHSRRSNTQPSVDGDFSNLVSD